MATTNTDAIEAAKARRAAADANRLVREEWFIDKVSGMINLSLENRVRLATEWVKNKVIVNISKPVTKVVIKGKRGRDTITGRFTAGKSRTVVTERSKPGEFPRADTTLLMKTIFSDYKTDAQGKFVGYVGTPIDYGLILEVYRDRTFLVRTLFEQRNAIERMLTKKIEE